MQKLGHRLHTLTHAVANNEQQEMSLRKVAPFGINDLALVEITN